ncbi:MAG: leucyl aminopeptidase [Planctomycetaceae bacterium]|nr:leucyl aminopeptidase [Planctomycetaceae bacterium]
MQFTTRQESIEQVEADAVVVGVYQDRLSSAAQIIDKTSDGLIQRLLESEEFKPEIGSLKTLYYLNGVKSPIVVLIGLGDSNELQPGDAYRATATAGRSLSSSQRNRLAFAADDSWSPNCIEAAVAGSLLGFQGPGLYHSEPKRTAPTELIWLTRDDEASQRGMLIGESVNLTRLLVDEPPHAIYPESFANVAQDVAAEAGMNCEVWDEHKLESENCGALLAVARGSSRPPRMVILRHQGGKETDDWLALVGKGVTFDSGGLSLKPSESMKAMKCDMAGAATVLGAMRAIAKLKLPINVMGLMGLVENMPGADAYKLGDVLTAKNGTTIEVHNTDAEGRLVLADALSVAVENNAKQIIDLATLTGACVVALGLDVAGLMTNDQTWCDKIASAADTAGEQVWQLPMFPEYGKQILGSVADIKNVGEGRWGGAITAAKLLERFVDETPWTHIDIAGPAFLEKSKPWLESGASGALVRTLIEVARQS